VHTAARKSSAEHV